MPINSGGVAATHKGKSRNSTIRVVQFVGRVDRTAATPDKTQPSRAEIIVARGGNKDEGSVAASPDAPQTPSR